MIDEMKITRAIINNIETGKVLVDDVTNNRVMIEENGFIKSYCVKKSNIFAEVIRELPREAKELKAKEEVNKLNGETFLEKYFISKEEGKNYFNMSILFSLHEEMTLSEIKVLVNYISKQAEAAYSKLII